MELAPERISQNSAPVHREAHPVAALAAAYGRDYRYSGAINRALPKVHPLRIYLELAQRQFDDRLNGLLLNWYDADLQHYIGAHSDSTAGLIAGTQIVTISFGATRIFRLRPRTGKGYIDFEAAHGSVFVLLGKQIFTPNMKCRIEWNRKGGEFLSRRERSSLEFESKLPFSVLCHLMIIRGRPEDAVTLLRIDVGSGASRPMAAYRFPFVCTFFRVSSRVKPQKSRRNLQAETIL